MAVLSDAIRTEVRDDYMRELSTKREVLAVLTKADLKATVDAVDQWVEDNKASYNSALPVTARTNLTAAQKSEILVFVVRRRFQEGE